MLTIITTLIIIITTIIIRRLRITTTMAMCITEDAQQDRIMAEDVQQPLRELRRRAPAHRLIRRVQAAARAVQLPLRPAAQQPRALARRRTRKAPAVRAHAALLAAQTAALRLARV